MVWLRKEAFIFVIWYFLAVSSPPVKSDSGVLDDFRHSHEHEDYKHRHVDNFVISSTHLHEEEVLPAREHNVPESQAVQGSLHNSPANNSVSQDGGTALAVKSFDPRNQSLYNHTHLTNSEPAMIANTSFDLTPTQAVDQNFHLLNSNQTTGNYSENVKKKKRLGKEKDDNFNNILSVNLCNVTHPGQTERVDMEFTSSIVDNGKC